MDKAELSQILKEAFRLYGYELAQTFNVPDAFEPLLTGDDAVVTLRLNKNNTITILEYETDETLKEELKACRKTVKEQATQIESLQETVEEPQPETKEEAVHMTESQLTANENPIIDVAPVEKPKPKKRRRQS